MKGAIDPAFRNISTAVVRLGSALPESDIVRLAQAERDNTLPTTARRTARILLALNPNTRQCDVVRGLGVSHNTINSAIAQYQTGGVELVLTNPPRVGQRPLAEAKKENILRLASETELTVRGIAKEAGVCFQTVCRVLKQHPAVSARRRAKKELKIPAPRKKRPLNPERYRRLFPRLSQDDQSKLIAAQIDLDLPAKTRRYAKVLLALNLDKSAHYVAKRLRVNHRISERVIDLYHKGGVEKVLSPLSSMDPRAVNDEKRRFVLELGMQPQLSMTKISVLADVSLGYVHSLLAWRRRLPVGSETLTSFIRNGRVSVISPPLSEADQARLVEAKQDSTAVEAVRKSARILLALNPDHGVRFVARQLRVTYYTVQTVLNRYQIGGVALVLLPPPPLPGRRAISADQKEMVRQFGMRTNYTLKEIAAKADVSPASVSKLLATRFNSAIARRVRIRSLEEKDPS